MTAGTEADGDSQVIRRRGMRTGFTTGACATAAAAAATRSLLSRQRVSSITIPLPAGVEATFAVECHEVGNGAIRCSVIKDAGDDPDVTHGAEIVAVVQRQPEPAILLNGGVGVGVVTLPGLGLEIGGPAINPVPRRMILEAVASEAGKSLEHEGLIVEISVPRGEELARRTLNARLGILGGISILGTTGIVRPFSTAAYRASVEQGVDVAVANGQREIAFSTGGRSERFAQSVLQLPEIAFVEMGEFTGHALRRCVRKGVRRAYICGMIGKLSKVAQGHFMTHVAGNRVDTAFLASLAAQAGAEKALEDRMAAANTAREVQELALAEHLGAFFELVAAATASSCTALVHGALEVECLLFDFDGTLLGRSTGAPRVSAHSRTPP
jgi:cobalt-precorrin-5B (C1)-methyltransferase